MTRNISELRIFPSDLNNLTVEELQTLCDEIRKSMIESVSETGGHIASNLGIVELTAAVHKVFNAPEDRIVWDVGHQAYVHKMLTGRAPEMKTLRQYGGLSGFPKRCESEYDTFDTGHSSTSVSAAVGMAAARDLRGEEYAVAAVIGDGAMTGGMVYEALNNAGILDSNLVVILNDNGMSISESTGSLSRHLETLRTSERYRNIKYEVKNSLNRVPLVGPGIARGISGIKDALKYAIVQGALFEELGFTYLGPVDGYDLESLIEVLSKARSMKSPVLVHCITRKGKGYLPAEEDPAKFHGIGPFDPETGEIKKKSSEPSWSEVFGNKLAEMALTDDRITAVSAAMTDGTGLKKFEALFPKRMFDVGIAEEHAVTFAAGMAVSGLKPYAAIYSTFLQRAYDQMMTDVCMQKLPVTFCIDRAGVVGADGETHQGIFDLSYLNHMPGMTVLAPSDRYQLEKMMEYSLKLDSPCAIRYPRGASSDLSSYTDLRPEASEDGSGWEPHPRLLRRGSDGCLAAAGSMTEICLEAAEKLQTEKGLQITVIDASVIKPLSADDEALYCRIMEETGVIITVEDNVTIGGFGSAVEDIFEDRCQRIIKLGWPDEFIQHGSRERLMAAYGLDADGIAEKVSEIIEAKA